MTRPVLATEPPTVRISNVIVSPSPFNADSERVDIDFRVDERALVSVYISSWGAVIKNIMQDVDVPAGSGVGVFWDGKNNAGADVMAGYYNYNIVTRGVPPFRSVRTVVIGTVIVLRSPAILNMHFEDAEVYDRLNLNIADSSPRQNNGVLTDLDGHTVRTGFVARAQNQATAVGNGAFHATLARYIDIPRHYSLTREGPMTIALWVHPDGTFGVNREQGLISTGDGNNFAWHLGLNNQNQLVYFTNPNNQYASIGMVDPDRWQMIGLVLDNCQQGHCRATFYKNGLGIGVLQNVPRASYLPNYLTRIGTWSGSVNGHNLPGVTPSLPLQNYFDGGIDELLIMERALTPAEILAFYQTTRNGVPVPPSGALPPPIVECQSITVQPAQFQIVGNSPITFNLQVRPYYYGGPFTWTAVPSGQITVGPETKQATLTRLPGHETDPLRQTSGIIVRSADGRCQTTISGIVPAPTLIVDSIPIPSQDFQQGSQNNIMAQIRFTAGSEDMRLEKLSFATGTTNGAIQPIEKFSVYDGVHQLGELILDDYNHHLDFDLTSYPITVPAYGSTILTVKADMLPLPSVSFIKSLTWDKVPANVCIDSNDNDPDLGDLWWADTTPGGICDLDLNGVAVRLALNIVNQGNIPLTKARWRDGRIGSFYSQTAGNLIPDIIGHQINVAMDQPNLDSFGYYDFNSNDLWDCDARWSCEPLIATQNGTIPSTASAFDYKLILDHPHYLTTGTNPWGPSNHPTRTGGDIIPQGPFEIGLDTLGANSLRAVSTGVQHVTLQTPDTSSQPMPTGLTMRTDSGGHNIGWLVGKRHGIAYDPNAANAPLPIVSFQTSTATVDEATGQINIPVTLSQPIGIAVTIPYYVNQVAMPGETLAQAGSDYIISSGPLVIPAGSRSGMIIVDITDDIDIENTDEIIKVALSANPRYATLGTNIIHTITITDNDVLVQPLPTLPGSRALRLTLDEATGVNFLDTSGNNYHPLSYQNGAPNEPQHVLGHLSGGARFDGNDYLEIPAAVDLNPTGDFTIEMFIEPSTNVGRFRTLYARTDDPAGNTHQFGLTIGWGAKLEFCTDCGNNGAFPGYYSVNGPMINSNQRYHIAVVARRINAQTITVRYYVNGIPEIMGQGQNPLGYTMNAPRNLPSASTYIGSKVGGGHGFVGLIDEVSVYNRALTDSEILQLAQR